MQENDSMASTTANCIEDCPNTSGPGGSGDGDTSTLARHLASYLLHSSPPTALARCAATAARACGATSIRPHFDTRTLPRRPALNSKVTKVGNAAVLAMHS